MKKTVASRLRALGGQWSRQNFGILLRYAVIALVLDFLLECLARHSVVQALDFLARSPLQFLFGGLIILFTLSWSLLSVRRGFWLLFLSTVWLGLGITDFIMLTFRSMPLTASDIWIMSSVRDIFEKYLSHVELALIMLAISIGLGAILLLWLRAKKYRAAHAFGAAHILLLGGVTFGLLVLFFQWDLLDRSTSFDSLPTAYGKNGFVYSFSASLVTSGVSEPEDYSPASVKEVMEGENNLPQTASQRPNIIVVQLESFFDPANLAQIETAENPVPNFRTLQEQCSTGLLSVPCIGAGTVNTEFEVLTGMNLSHFGVGEYPYTTIADAFRIQSLASVLGELGYHTQAIHNNNATFYGRNVVYENFGFDGFTSIEYMDVQEYNPLGWAKDEILTDEILKALEATEEQDFILTVSVQPHGKYPKEVLEGAPTIAATGFTDEGRQTGFEFYLGQLKECDAFVGALVEALEDYLEPTVVVFYGDHLPSFNFTQEELAVGTNQTTEYVLWANFPLERETRDLEAYQLGAYVLERCGIHEGDIFRLHQSYAYDAQSEDLQNDLQMLEYDMIYGEQYAGSTVPDGTTLRLGTEPVTVTRVEQAAEGTYRICGTNFTPYSRVVIDGETYPTQYLSSGALLVANWRPVEEQSICVAQISASDEMELLSQSQPFSLRKADIQIRPVYDEK